LLFQARPESVRSPAYWASDQITAPQREDLVVRHCDGIDSESDSNTHGGAGKLGMR